MKSLFFISALALVMTTAATSASATVYSGTLGEYNGDGTIANTFIGEYTGVPTGETIIAASFTSSFGNSMIDSSAIGDVTLNGIVVGVCSGPGDPCYDSPGAPISYTFTASQLAMLNGPIDLYYDQTGCCVIRLGESTLTLTTGLAGPAGVPEPAAWTMMLAGFGMTGFVLRRRAVAAIA